MKRHLQLMGVLLISLVVLSGCKPASKGKAEPLQPKDSESVAAIGFSIPAIGGGSGNIDLSAYKGQVVLLDFWATWCPPCRSELGTLDKMYKDLKDKGFVLIGMTVDDGSVAEVAQAVSQFSLSYPVGWAGPEVQQAYGGIRAVPTKFLLDKNGAVQKRYVGVAPEEQIRADIATLLAM